MSATWVSVTMLWALGLGLGLTGCRRGPEVTIGAPLTMESTPSVPPESLEVARGFVDTIVDEGVARLAKDRVGRYLREAERRGLDRASLERALGVASAKAPGTRSVVAGVRPASAKGRAAWLVIQAWGYEGGTMDYARAWLIDAATGTVLSTVSVRL